VSVLDVPSRWHYQMPLNQDRWPDSAPDRPDM
jgi:hypothetical protein